MPTCFFIELTNCLCYNIEKATERGQTMSLFESKLNKIRQDVKKGIMPYQNSETTLRMYEQKSQTYIQEICEDIRNQILSAAERGIVFYDQKKKLFSAYTTKKVNPHYIAWFETVFRIRCDESVFSFEPISCCQPYGDDEVRKGFIVNDMITVRYIFDQVEKILAKDNIFPIREEFPSKVERETFRTSVPIAQVENTLRESFSKAQQNNYTAINDIFLTIRFAYFIKE